MLIQQPRSDKSITGPGGVGGKQRGVQLLVICDHVTRCHKYL